MNNKLFQCSLSLALFGCVACNQSDEPTDQDYNDVAQAVGSMVSGSGNADSGEVSEMSDIIDISAGEMPAEMTREGSGTITGLRGGLMYEFSIQCQDSLGATQEACDGSTDSATVSVDWNGSVDWPRYDASVSRTGDWSLSDIQSGTAVFNGDGTFDVQSEFRSLDGQRTRTFDLQYAANYDQILIDTNTRIIQGGVASYDIAAQRTGSNSFRDVEAEFEIEAVVTFTGNGQAQLSLDGSRSYQIDLNNGTVTGM